MSPGTARRPPRTARASLSLMLLVGSGILTASGLGMTIALVSGLLGDGRDLTAMAIPAASATVVGGLGLMATPRPDSSLIRPVAGFAAVTMAWAVAAVIGAVPFLAAGVFDSPIDAVFEAMSGFTTTGATLIDDVDAQSDVVLMWRSVSHWLGGIGIVVLVVAIAPLARMGLQRVFYAEASGISADRLTPRISDTAKIIAGIYLALSAAAGIAYAIAGMSVFDAVNHAMATIATGGFSTRTASIAAFDSAAIEIVAAIFMLTASINFAVYWRLVKGKTAGLQLGEAISFFAIVAVAVVAVSVSLEMAGDSSSPARGIRDAAFTVASVISTTGFTTADFDNWNEFARFALLGLMVIGGCAGSTAGGMKVIRVVLLGKTAGQELNRQTQPNRVQVLRLRGQNFSEDVRVALLGYLLVYVIVFAAGCLAFALSGLGPASSVSGTAATLNNIGPGLGDVGALENFSAMSPGARVVATVLMLAGRLEIFTVFALLAAAVGAIMRRR